MTRQIQQYAAMSCYASYRYVLYLLVLLVMAGAGLVFVISPLVNCLFYCLGLLFLAFFCRIRLGFYFASAMIWMNSLYIVWDSAILVSPTAGAAKLPVYNFIIVVLFAAFLLFCALNREKNAAGTKSNRLPGTPLEVVGFFFVFWVTLSLFWSVYRNWGLTIYLELISAFLLTLMMPRLLQNKQDLCRFLLFMFWVGVVLALQTFLSLWFYGEVISFEIADKMTFVYNLIVQKGRLGGFNGINHASTVLNLFIVLSFTLIVVKKYTWKHHLFLLLLLIAEILTGSKSGFFSLIVALGIIIVFLPQLRSKRITCGALFFMTILAAFVIAASFKGAAVRSVNVGTSFSYTTRLDWWHAGFIELFHSFGIGLGTGGFAAIISPIMFAHNIFLSALFDLGLIGFFLFVTICIYTAASLYDGYRKCADPELAGICVCLLAASLGFYLNNLVQGDYYNRIFWFMLGLNVAVINIVSNYDALSRMRGVFLPSGRGRTEETA